MITKMSHQDWKEINIGNPNNASKTKRNYQTEAVRRNQHHGVKEVDMDENRIKMVSPQLRKAFEQARVNSIDPQTERCYTHDKLAKMINGDPKVIKQLESGKLSEKEAKQVILKVEKVLRVKILGVSSIHP